MNMEKRQSEVVEIAGDFQKRWKDLRNGDAGVSEHFLINAGYPSALAKACGDPFDYELKLTTGKQIKFAKAYPINAEWVSIYGQIRGSGISGSGKDKYFENKDLPRAPRGLEIRISEIVWVCDAPEGS